MVAKDRNGSITVSEDSSRIHRLERHDQELSWLRTAYAIEFCDLPIALFVA
jgi:hypothetical protein